MKNQTTVTGKLEIIHRMPSSINGNPRYFVRINGQTCKTKPDSDSAYSITNYDGKTVSAIIGTYYGSVHCEHINAVK